MTNANFDAEEREFQLEIAEAMRGVRSRVGPCPHPDQLMATVAGVEFQDVAAVKKHLAECAICQQLSRDLSGYEIPGLSREEDRRIRQRWSESPKQQTGFTWWKWLSQPMPMAAAAAIVIVVLIIGSGVLRQSAPVPETATIEPKPVPVAPARVAFVLEKAVVKVPAAAVLVFRSGEAADKAYFNDLAAALEPYRMDNYSEAVRLLDQVVKKYPAHAESAYYLGVSRLLLNQNDLALDALLAAAPHADESLRDDISWYLALALERSGKIVETRQQLDSLCGRAGEYQQKACTSLDELRR